MKAAEHSSRKLGMGMLAIAWAVILGLLGLYFNDKLNHQHNPNASPISQRDKQVTEVILLPNRQHHYVASGEINQQEVVFLLDTGATEVVIPSGLADKLGLSRGLQKTAYTANGTVVVYTTSIEQLALGAIELNDLPASINPAMKGNTILLGMSALSQLEFNQNAERLVLRQSQ